MIKSLKIGIGESAKSFELKFDQLLNPGQGGDILVNNDRIMGRKRETMKKKIKKLVHALLISLAETLEKR